MAVLFRRASTQDSKVSTNAQAGNRQKEQVTREHGCATLLQLLQCFLSWTRMAHLGSDLHSCPKTSIIARKGKLPVDRTAPTDEQRRQPPEKASSPWHGCAISRNKYLGFKSVYERTSRKPPERASYPWTWLCYFTSLAEVLRLRTNNTGNRQKEQVTREHGCAILPQLLKCAGNRQKR